MNNNNIELFNKLKNYLKTRNLLIIICEGWESTIIIRPDNNFFSFHYILKNMADFSWACTV